MEKMAAVIMAAGKGTRMKSDLPKVLHRVMGKSLICYPTQLALGLKCERVVLVVGHGRDEVEAAVRDIKGADRVAFALQEQQLGTGHAVMCGMKALKGTKGPVLILSGDVPLLDKASIDKLKKAFVKSGGRVAFLTFSPEDPAQYGRVLREKGDPVAIREYRDCSRAERQVGEVNAGIYLVDPVFLKKAIKNIGTNNDQGEFYLTDLVEQAAKLGKVGGVEVSPEVVQGINDRADLAAVEETLSMRINEAHMKAGVTIQNPRSVRIETDVKVGADTVIGAGVSLLGSTRIGKGVTVETGAVITDSKVADRAVIKAYCVLESAKVGSEAEIGPMGRLRPGADIRKKAKVGNFVELKKTILGEGSKASHLSYLGDGEIGAGVNIGAGTIFCNYDGFQKHKTVLEDDVFIGSDSQLVAPVTVGKGAYVASGSTVTKDVPKDALAVSRVKQENKLGVAAALKRRLMALKKKALEAKSKKDKSEK